jgi:hypothetical protein
MKRDTALMLLVIAASLVAIWALMPDMRHGPGW